MATAAVPRAGARIARVQDLILPVCIMASVAVILVPVPPAVMDVLLSANITIGETMRTMGLRQYRPEGADDGHFVSTRTAQGRADTSRFLMRALSGETPSIGE